MRQAHRHPLPPPCLPSLVDKLLHLRAPFGFGVELLPSSMGELVRVEVMAALALEPFRDALGARAFACSQRDAA